MPEIRIVGIEDGNYTIYSGREVIASGLTHGQAMAHLVHEGARLG